MRMFRGTRTHKPLTRAALKETRPGHPQKVSLWYIGDLELHSLKTQQLWEGHSEQELKLPGERYLPWNQEEQRHSESPDTGEGTRRTRV